MSDEQPVSYVKLMREIRDEINREIAGMSAAEEARWFAEQRAELERSGSGLGTPDQADPHGVARHRC
ncbi:MAG: hypothetical protein ICV87_14105 [Gemmatimonadetes bacterium]|nr:hypothetical protein [Gemmatimonadota bacterium]